MLEFSRTRLQVVASGLLIPFPFLVESDQAELERRPSRKSEASRSTRGGEEARRRPERL